MYRYMVVESFVNWVWSNLNFTGSDTKLIGLVYLNLISCTLRTFDFSISLYILILELSLLGVVTVN